MQAGEKIGAREGQAQFDSDCALAHKSADAAHQFVEPIAGVHWK